MQKPLIAGVLFLFLTPGMRAQDVTEEEFLAGLQDDSDAVRALEEGMARAEGVRLEARTLSNPRVEFWREQPDSNPQVTNWVLAWTPPLDGRYGLGKKAAEENLAAARRHFEADRAALRREFRKVFADWSVSLERREVLREQLDVISSLAERERQRARAGEGSGLAARRFTLVEGEVRTEAGDAVAAYARADAAARALRTSLPEEASPAPAPLPDPPDVLDASAAPQLRALVNEKAQAEYEARRANRYLGFPNLQLGWQTLEDGDESDSGLILGAGWSLPVANRDQGARLEAERMRGILEARLAFARTRLAGEVKGGLEAYRTLFGTAAEAQRTAGESRMVIDAATAAFRAGETGLTDLLDALRSAFAARLRAVDARARALEAHRDLEAAMGRPLTGGGNP